MIFRQFLRKRAKIWRGIRRTFLQRTDRPYQADSWWDAEFFTRGLSDRQTIAPDKNPLSAAYHYASVELLILRHLRNGRADLAGARCCDLGSGSGHWIDFYLGLGAAQCAGIDISEKAAAFLRQKYAGDNRVTIHHGRLLDRLPQAGGPFDLVNAIGVMFHLVDDTEWERTLHEVGRSVRPGGWFVAGGQFGWLDGVNVQFDDQHRVNKRLHSARRWRRVLRAAGFDPVTVHRNRAYLFIRDSLPENHVLMARKR